MVFSSMVFLWIFLPVVLAGSFLFRRPRFQNILLLIASLIFYAWGEPVYVLLLLLSVAANWGFGLLMDRFPGRKRGFLVLSVVFNLSLLGWFKYADFLFRTLGRLFPGAGFTLPGVALPVGISFFTFQAMSYVIDLYRGEYPVQKNPFHLALYISFFPQLIAGPIVKYREVQQALSRRTRTAEDLAEGIRRFLYGLGKKVIISNVIAYPVDKIFDGGWMQMGSGAIWAGSLLYTLQIYYDFSGYSDMAIGLGRMFGFHFSENFNYPYVAASVRDFWRRWHISLSSWFREYLYIPLGGNRRGGVRTCINLMIVFATTGLWHGASWNFVCWGLFHGCFLLLERTAAGGFLERHRAAGHVYTLLVVVTGWVMFRANGMAQGIRILKKMFLPFGAAAGRIPLMTLLTPQVMIAALCGVIGMGFAQRFTQNAKNARLAALPGKWRGSAAEAVFLGAVLFVSIVLLATNSYNPFIYYKF